MATAKLSAWTSRSTVLTTELNSLANNSRTAAGTQVDNGANLDELGALQLKVTFGSAPTAGGYIDVYMVTAPDGSTYEDGSASVAPDPSRRVARFNVRAVTTAQILNCKPFALEPAKSKFILDNQSGQAFPASGSTLELFTANETIS